MAADLSDTVESHATYLTSFLSSGFAALKHLEQLDRKDAAEDDRPEASDADEQAQGKRHLLPGLGSEKAGKLLAACVAEPSLLSAVYWVVCGHALVGKALPAELQGRTLEFILSCRCQSGGFSPHPNHPAHILPTLSAVQLLILLGRRDMLEVGGPCRAEEIISYVRSLRLPDGSFRGRTAVASEGDCRFVYAALCTLSLLIAPADPDGDSQVLDETVAWLLRCQNLDGGFGCRPDGECESHAGHTFCSLASLRLADESGKLSLPPRNRSRLVRWLCDRQCGTAGGLNGRPGKAPDVCYTWWTLASVELLRGRCGKASTETAADLVDELDMADFFDLSDLRGFIAKCMCSAGGVAAHPGDDPDPFHTFFGLAGLSLLDHADTSRTGAKPWLASISPVLAMPVSYVP